MRREFFQIECAAGNDRGHPGAPLGAGHRHPADNGLVHPWRGGYNLFYFRR
jgi:hypothetical protein